MSARTNSRPAATDRRRRWLIWSVLVGLVVAAAACSSSHGDVPRSSTLKDAGVLAPGPPERSVDKQPDRSRLRIEFWGDSLGQQTAEYLRFFFQAGDNAVATIHAFGGTAICDWFADMRKEVDPADPAAFHPQVAVLEFNGDTGSPCMRDIAGSPYTGQDLVRKYLADSATAIDIFARINVPVYFVTNPLDSLTGELFTNFTQIGQLFAQLPKWHPAGGLVRWIDAATPLELNGRFTYTLPCLPWETCTGAWPDGTKTVTVRQADGLHFCPVTEYEGFGGLKFCPVPMPGAARYAIAISGPVLRDFRLSGGSS